MEHFRLSEEVTHLWRINVHLGEQLQSWHVTLTQGFAVWTDRRGTLGVTNHGCTVLNIAVKKEKKLFSVLGFSSRLSEKSWPSAVWISTVRKTLQQWAKVLARSACGRSSMTECHSSSQHCDVQSASTSRPWPAPKRIHNRGKVRIKQARRMIAATLPKIQSESRILFFPPL